MVDHPNSRNQEKCDSRIVIRGWNRAWKRKVMLNKDKDELQRENSVKKKDCRPCKDIGGKVSK